MFLLLGPELGRRTLLCSGVLCRALCRHADLDVALVLRLTPVDLGQHQREVHVVLIANSDVHKLIEQGIGKIVRLEPQIDQLRMLGIVVVLLGFDTGIGNVVDFNA